MLHDSVPILNEFPERQDIKVSGIFDMHYGAAGFQAPAWIDFKRSVLSDPNHFLIFGGDMLNNATKESVSDVYADTVRPRRQKEWLADEFADLKGHMLGVLRGNHEHRSEKAVDSTPVYDVCVRLGLEKLYRENAIYLVTRFGEKKGAGKQNPTYMTAVYHGVGGGKKKGGAVNRYTDYARGMEGFDMLMAGHIHQAFHVPDARLCFDPHNMRVRERPFMVISGSPWLAYDEYAVRMMLTPSARVTEEVTLCGDHKEIKASMSMRF